MNSKIEKLKKIGIDEKLGKRIAKEYTKLVKVFMNLGVDKKTAEWSAVSSIAREHGIDPSELIETPEVKINEISGQDEWITVQCKVIELWENNHGTIKQVGLIADETGMIKFVTWMNTDIPLVEKNKSYKFENVIVREYDGKKQISINRKSKITELKSDIKTTLSNKTIEGAIVDIQDGTGYIKRCKCNKVLSCDGVCPEHGKVTEYKDDLRIKAILDDGKNAYSVVFNEEQTTEVASITLEEAKKEQQQCIFDKITKRIFAHYLKLEGYQIEDNFIVTGVI